MAFTPGWSCKARCTVPVDIPRASAISKRVTRRVVLMVSSRNQRTEPKVSTCPQASCRGSVNDSGHYSRLTKAKWARNFLLATGRVNFHALQGLAKAGLFQGANGGRRRPERPGFLDWTGPISAESCVSAYNPGLSGDTIVAARGECAWSSGGRPSGYPACSCLSWSWVPRAATIRRPRI